MPWKEHHYDLLYHTTTSRMQAVKYTHNYLCQSPGVNGSYCQEHHTLQQAPHPKYPCPIIIQLMNGRGVHPMQYAATYHAKSNGGHKASYGTILKCHVNIGFRCWCKRCMEHAHILFVQQFGEHFINLACSILSTSIHNCLGRSSSGKQGY